MTNTTQPKTNAQETSETKQPSAAPKVIFPLWLKLALVSSLLAAIPLGFLGSSLLQRSSDDLESSIRKYHDVTLHDISFVTQQNISQAKQALWEASRILSNQEMPADAKIALLQYVVEGSPAVDFISIYTKEGQRVDSINEVKDPPHAQSLDLKRSPDLEGFVLGDAVVFQSQVRVEGFLPIKTKDGEITGYVQTLFPLALVQDRLEILGKARDEGVSDEEYYVLDASGLRLADPDVERALERKPFELGIEELKKLDEQQKERVIFRRDRTTADGQVMLSSAQLIQNTPWSVVVETPRARAFEPIISLRQTVWISVGASILIAILLSLLISAGITRPVKRLVEFAKELSARRFSSRISLNTKDEISVLGYAMSKAAEDLESSEAALKKEAEIRSDLSRYMPKEVVERVVRREQSMSLGGEKRNITVLFADVVGFTPLSEKLSPETSVAILNHLFTVLTEIVFKHQGTVDKFIGDCVMAFFGAPTPQEDHAARAIAAAEEMLRWLDVGNASWQKRYGVTIQLAIGINSGEAIVGNVGSETRMEYTAIGDVVNVAARLESIARPQQILLSRATVEAAGDVADFVPVGEKTLLGREKPVEVFEVEL